MGRAVLVRGLLTVALIVGAAGCGGDEGGAPAGGAEEAPSSSVGESSAGASSAGDDPSAGAAPVAVVNLDGVSYRFEGVAGDCRDVAGGLIAGLLLSEVDDTASSDAVGTFQMSLYPEGLESESQISVDIPAGDFLAGYNEIGLDTAPISVERDGLTVSGEQSMTTRTGETSTVSIDVDCG